MARVILFSFFVSLILILPSEMVTDLLAVQQQSPSGVIHLNDHILCNMPMFITDHNNPSKLIFFYQGSGMQLGAEGFSASFYTIMGVLLALVINVLVYAKNTNLQRALMFIAILVSFWAVKKVIYPHNWKTRYTIRAFWRSPRH